MQVRFAHGGGEKVGEIVERESVRGHTQVLVAGKGFRIWVDEHKTRRVAATPFPQDEWQSEHVDKDNSTTLPYNPEPQAPADLFSHSPNILPGEYEIDRDDRLHPADSLSFDERSEDKGPGPARELFAASPVYPPGAFGPDDDGESVDFADLVADVYPEYDRLKDLQEMAAGYSYEEDSPYSAEIQKLKRQRRASTHYANPAALAVPIARAVGPAIGGQLLGDDEEDDSKEFNKILRGDQDEYDQGLVDKGRDESPLGMVPFLASADLSLDKNRYATWILDAANVDHYNDPVQRFRDDPIREIHRQGSVFLDAHDPEAEQYGMLIEADKEMREAAWADVRDKAKRLRSQGAIDVHDIAPDRIYASVKGDNAVYDVMVKKGGEFGGFGNGQSVADYSCSCQWGRWAFKRQYKFVGRMCSHALAAYHEMQSQHYKDNPIRRKRTASRTAGAVEDYKSWLDEVGAGVDVDSATDFVANYDDDLSDDDVAKIYDYVADNPTTREERDYTDPYGDLSDILYSGPGRLAPDLVVGDEGSDNEFVDVESDDRETTGPGQIQHFANRFLYADDDGAGSLNIGMDGPSGGPGGFGWGVFDPKALGLGGGGDSSASSGPTPTEADAVSAYTGVPAGGTPSATTTPAADGGDSHGWWSGSGDASGANAGAGLGAGTGGGAAGGGSPSAAGDGGMGSSATDGLGGAGGGGWQPNGNTETIGAGEYEIQEGDTLSSIAERAGIEDYNSIADANDNITNPDEIFAGDTINIPGAEGFEDATGAPAEADAGTGTFDGGLGVSTAEPSVTGGDALDLGAGGATGAGTQDSFDMGVADSSAPVDVTPAPEVDSAAASPFKATAARWLFADDVDTLQNDPAEPGSTPNTTVSSEPATPTAADLKNDPAEPGSTPNTTPGAGSNGGSSPTDGFSFDPGMLMDIAEPVISGVTSFAQPLAQGLGNAVSNMFLGGRFASAGDGELLDKLRELSAEPHSNNHGRMEQHNDEVLGVVEELRDRGYDAEQLVASIRRGYVDSFQGSGPSPKHWHETSESYVEDNERPRHVDVTDAEGDIIKYTKDKPQQRAAGVQRAGRAIPRVTPRPSSGDPNFRPTEDFGYNGTSRVAAPAASQADSDELVRRFHASGAGNHLLGDSSPAPGQVGDEDISRRAAALIRTAGRHYSPAEQRELEAEFHPLGARNKPTDEDLEGTHYLV